MQFNQLVERARAIVLQPRATWPVIAAETTSTAQLYRDYLVVLAAIPAVCGFIGTSLIGFGGFGITVRIPILTGLVNMVGSYVLTLGIAYVMALIADALAPRFGGQRDMNQALKLVVYSSTPALLGGVFSLIPALWLLGFLAALYSFYLLYLGLPVLMRVPKERAVGYTVLLAVAGFVLGLLVGAVSTLFTSQRSVMGSAASSPDAHVSVRTPQGQVSIDTSALQAAGERMAQASRALEQAQQRGDTAAATAAAGQVAAAVGALGGAQGSVGVETLKAALPPQLGSLARSGVKAESTNAAGVAMSQASADFGDAAGSHVRVEIMDMGGMGALAQLAGLVQSESERDGRVEKTWQADGRTLQEDYRKDGSSAELRAILKNGLVVSLEGQRVPAQDLRRYLQQIDLTALESLPRKSTAQR